MIEIILVSTIKKKKKTYKATSKPDEITAD